MPIYASVYVHISILFNVIDSVDCIIANVAKAIQNKNGEVVSALKSVGFDSDIFQCVCRQKNNSTKQTYQRYHISDFWMDWICARKGLLVTDWLPNRPKGSCSLGLKTIISRPEINCAEHSNLISIGLTALLFYCVWIEFLCCSTERPDSCWCTKYDRSIRNLYKLK